MRLTGDLEHADPPRRAESFLVDSAVQKMAIQVDEVAY